MSVATRIFNRVRHLPGHLQAEILEFVEYVAGKSRACQNSSTDIQWQEFALSEALREIDDETGPEYLESDIKYRFE